MDFETLSTKYLGEKAAVYNERRTALPRWDREQNAIAELVRQVDKGARILDVPVGTGRVFPFYQEREAKVTGLDISPDMLAVAGQYAEELQFDVELRQGDIRSIPFDDSAFDLVTCIRFLNWIDFDGVRQCLAELTRVSRDKLLLGIRQKTPYGDLRPSRNDLVRLAHLLSRHSKRRARREGLIYHTRSQVRGLFAEFGLEIVDFRQTDGRWDGTDYLIYLLRRSRQ